METNEANFPWNNNREHGSVYPNESPVNPDTSSAAMSSNLLEMGTSPLDLDSTSRDVLEIFENDQQVAQTLLTRRVKDIS